MIYKSQALDFTKNGANGLNLALGTAGNYPASSWGFHLPENAYGQVSGLELTKETYEGATIVQWNGNESVDGVVVGPFISVKKLIPNGYQVNKTYTISVWLRADYEASFNCGYLAESHTLISTSGGQKITTTWQRFSATFVAQREVSNICFYTGKGATAGAEKVYMCGIKIEEGSFATSWCPAIEDQLVANINNDFSWKFSPTEGMYMWNGEQGDGSNSDPNLVFKVWENPSSSKDNKKELFVKGHIEATSGNISGVNMDNLAGTEEGLRENLVAKEDVGKTNVTINSTTGFLWNVTKTGGYGGLKIASSLFELGEKYILSYRIQRTAGELVNIAGHSDGFTLKKQYINNTPFDFNSSIFGVHYGVDKTNLEKLGSLDQEFYVVVVLEFHGNSGEGNNNLYIQPNRNTDTPITYNIWDIKLEKIENGEQDLPTKWSPSPRDLFSWKFSSTEGLYMWNGPAGSGNIAGDVASDGTIIDDNSDDDNLVFRVSEDAVFMKGGGQFKGSVEATSGSFTGSIKSGDSNETDTCAWSFSSQGGMKVQANMGDPIGEVTVLQVDNSGIRTSYLKSNTLSCNKFLFGDQEALTFTQSGTSTIEVFPKLTVTKTDNSANLALTLSLYEKRSDGTYVLINATKKFSVIVTIYYLFEDWIGFDYKEERNHTIDLPVNNNTITKKFPAYITAKAAFANQTYSAYQISYRISDEDAVTSKSTQGAINFSTTWTKTQTTNSTPQVVCHGNLIPNRSGYTNDNGATYVGFNLGDGSHKWAQVYAARGTINTSDEKMKKNISPLSENYEILFNNLAPKTFNYTWSGSDRTHTGFVAQQVKESLSKANLTTMDFGAYCESKLENGTVECGLRYGEFVALNTWQIQKLKPRMASAEEKLLAYESRISALEKEIENLKKS